MKNVYIISILLNHFAERLNHCKSTILQFFNGINKINKDVCTTVNILPPSI